MNLEFIFKVIDKEEWQKAKQSGTYGGSEKDIKDGYIHFSEEDQVEETLKKFYPNDFPKNTSVGVANPRVFLGSLLSNPLAIFNDLSESSSNRLHLVKNRRIR